MKALNFAIFQFWAILPDALQTILQIAARENATAVATAKLDRVLVNKDAVETQNNIAILSVTGSITRHTNFFSHVCGATPIDTLTSDLQQASANSNIKAIILNIDSPGGTVSGINELADMIYHARQHKPIIAYVSGMGASAAYWLASAASEIVLDATASVGSIGVVSVLYDDKEHLAKNGIKEIQIVSSISPRKRLDITTDEGRADMQTLVDAIADVFVEAVARNRGVTIEKVLADFGQGRLLVGAHAVRAGLADRTGSLAQIIQELSHSTQRGKTMTQPSNNESIEITADYLTQHYPAIANALRLEGAQQERERIQAVESQSIAGHEALIQTLKFDGKTSGAEAALQILAAEKHMRATTLAHLKADAPQPVPMPGVQLNEKATDHHPEATLPPEQQLTQQWQTNPKLREEFLTQQAYVAFMKAQQQGQIQLYSRNHN